MLEKIIIEILAKNGSNWMTETAFYGLFELRGFHNAKIHRAINHLIKDGKVETPDFNSNMTIIRGK